MIKAYFKYWKKTGDFKSFSSRSDYWWVFLVNFIIFTLISIIHFFTLIPQAAKILNEAGSSAQAELMQKIVDLSTKPTGSAFVVVVVTFLAGAIILIPNMSLTARRLRDAGFPWWFSLIFGLAAFQELVAIFWNTGNFARLGLIANLINLVVYILCLFPAKYGEDEADDSRQYE